MLLSKTNQLGLCPHEAAFGSRPSDEWLRTFGQKCAVKQLNRKSKDDIPGRFGIWVGYAEHSKSHRIVYEKSKGKRAGYVETQHVRFPHDEVCDATLKGVVPFEAGDASAADPDAGAWNYDTPDVEFDISNDGRIKVADSLSTGESAQDIDEHCAVENAHEGPLSDENFIDHGAQNDSMGMSADGTAPITVKAAPTYVNININTKIKVQIKEEIRHFYGHCRI
jgi:hypothetical protein